jgi:hypothetical protein
MSILGSRLGPLLFQFPYFNTEVFQSGIQFLSRLKAFFQQLPKDKKFAVEIRNKRWIKPQFLDLLREFNVAFVLQDQVWMPRPADIFQNYNPITADFTYIRWLGDRKGIEKITKIWDRPIINRTSELQEWVKYCQKIQKRGVTMFRRDKIPSISRRPGCYPRAEYSRSFRNRLVSSGACCKTANTGTKGINNISRHFSQLGRSGMKFVRIGSCEIVRGVLLCR